MPETPDCWEVLADKMIGWMDPKNHSADPIGEIAYEYWRLGKLLKSQLPPSHERQVSLRKLLESFNWAIRVRNAPQGEPRHAIDFNSIDFWMRLQANVGASDVRQMAYQFFVVHEATLSRLGCGSLHLGLERVQAAQLLLESRDAAVRACLDMLAEQQKQVLRAVSQSE
jgi:hypothetical protein